jgi:hypothetical protein
MGNVLATGSEAGLVGNAPQAQVYSPVIIAFVTAAVESFFGVITQLLLK